MCEPGRYARAASDLTEAAMKKLTIAALARPGPAPPAPAAFPGQNGKIAFTSARDGRQPRTSPGAKKSPVCRGDEAQHRHPRRRTRLASRRAAVAARSEIAHGSPLRADVRIGAACRASPILRLARRHPSKRQRITHLDDVLLATPTYGADTTTQRPTSIQKACRRTWKTAEQGERT